jgi:hypothetical protein
MVLVWNPDAFDDELDDTGKEVEKLGDVVRETTNAMANMPNGFKVAGARFAALDSMGQDFNRGSGNSTAANNSGATTNIGTVMINQPTTSGEELLSQMQAEAEWQSFSNSGNPTGQTSQGMTGGTGIATHSVTKQDTTRNNSDFNSIGGSNWG